MNYSNLVTLNLNLCFVHILQLIVDYKQLLDNKMKKSILRKHAVHRDRTQKLGTVFFKKFYKNREKLIESSATRKEEKSASHLREDTMFTAKLQLPLFHWVKKIPAHYFLVLGETVLDLAVENEILIFYPGILPYYRHNTKHGV